MTAYAATYALILAGLGLLIALLWANANDWNGK